MAGKTAETFVSFRQRLLNFIRSRVNRLEDAEDILQDVFYQFSRIDDLINPIENISAWLYRAARNKIIDHHKKKRDDPLPASYDEDNDEYIFDEIADIIYGEEATPETEMLRSLVFEEIQTALADLPKEQREVFEMTELLDFSVKETAEKTKTPVNTVLSRKHYAVKFLRKRLEELYSDVMGRYT
jgi:RNA polymerase sigma factor (sigma-70 family)